MTSADAPRRPYDNSRRRAGTEQARRRILATAAEMVETLPIRDWGGLTLRAVAERSGVSERTLYRHFGSERELHEAIVGHVKERAGVDYDGMTLDDLAETARRTIQVLDGFSPPRPDVAPDVTIAPALAAENEKRHAALLGAVDGAGRGWSEQERLLAAAALDMVWDVPAYERLVAEWNLTADQASRTVTWAIEALVAALRVTGPPGPGGPPARAHRKPGDENR